jgi:hypothetical protein
MAYFDVCETFGLLNLPATLTAAQIAGYNLKYFTLLTSDVFYWRLVIIEELILN